MGNTSASGGWQAPGARGGGGLRRVWCLVLCALFLPIAACKSVPQDLLLPKEVLIAREEARIQTGGKRGFLMPMVSIGGKGKYTRQGTDELITFEWDDEKSFSQAMMAAATGLYSWGEAAKSKASEETARVAAQEGTKRAANSNAADLAKLKESNRHAEALMEFETAPVAPAVP